MHDEEPPIFADMAGISGAAGSIVSALSDLGFSQYEARTYVGLVGREPMTGYAVAKATKVPQPKVYETLGRLVDRGAALQVSDGPARFVAVPPARLLAHMDSEYRQRLASAELELSRLSTSQDSMQALRAYPESQSWVEIASTASQLIDACRDRLYVSGHSDYLASLRQPIQQADRRGVAVDVLCFGEIPFELANGRVVKHSSTDRIVYRHHQARHLAVNCDSSTALWALASDRQDWQAIWCRDDLLLSSIIKGFVRHDLFVQRIYADFKEELHARYGPGLSGLFPLHTSDQYRRENTNADNPIVRFA